MFYKVLSSSVKGIEGYIVTVEVDIAGGFPRFDIIGLPDSSVRESVDRVRTSLRNSGYELPVERITVNLAPAHLRKAGAGFDLAIAIGILACKEKIPREECEGVLFLGELSLNGEIRPIKGMLPMIHAASKRGVKRCLVPCGNAKEASVVSEIEVIGVNHLQEAVSYLKKVINIERTMTDLSKVFSHKKTVEGDYCEVRGQLRVKRAVEVSVSGMHNIMMIGPPGSGKTMIAKRIPSIMPPISYEESIDITKIRSVSGLIQDGTALVSERPFRAPHHTISNTAMIGGGSMPKPGEISLAHNGVLFLDELPEYKKSVIEVLRQPLEDGKVRVSRVNATVEYPSDFMLVASMNPCPCGHHPDIERCQCTPLQIQRYLGRISAPILDRIDVHVEAGAINYSSITDSSVVETSQAIAKRVKETIEIQYQRYKALEFSFNGQLRPKEVMEYCTMEKDAKLMMQYAFDKMGLSVRGYHRMLKVGRTIADMDRSDKILEKHIAEAIGYRTLDRKYWHGQ